MNNNKVYNYVIENKDQELVISDYYGNRTVIGFTKQYVEELEALCKQHKDKKEEYYNLLVEKGILKKELTAEEKLDILINKIEEQANRITQLESMVTKPEGGENA